MPRITYTGPYDEVDLPALGMTCKRGASITVDDPELAASLLEQDVWAPVTTKATKEAVR